jgi:hypothetical protein
MVCAGGMSSLDDGVRSWYMEIRVESIWEEYLGGVFESYIYSKE